MNKLIKHISVLGMAFVALCGCAQNQSLTYTAGAEPKVHQYVEQLARQLFDSIKTIDPQQNIAIGTILPVDLGEGKNMPEAHSIGLQIQESLNTFVTQVGLSVVEYRATSGIVLEDQQDRMLSREQEPGQTVNIRYFLTGTYTHHEGSYVVNLRLVELPSKVVLAAATDYIPTDILWPHNRVSVKGARLIRTES